MKRLLKNLNPWKYFLGIALVLAMVSSILALIAPNKLSDFADLIGDGLVPKTEKFTEINQAIYSNLTEEKIQVKMGKMVLSSSISPKDQNEFKEIMVKMSNSSSEEKAKLFASIPKSILTYLLEDVKVDGVTISVDDQLAMLDLVSEMRDETGTDKALELMDKLPKSVYKIIEPEMNMTKIKRLAILMAMIYIISALFSFIQSFIMSTISNRFAQKLRTSITTKINKLPLRYFDTHETGDVLSRVTNDVDTISQNLNNSLATLVSSLTLFVGSIIMMFVTNATMAITTILASVIGFALMFVILGKSQKYFAKNQKALGDLNGYIEEIYSGHNVVKAYNGSKEAIEKFDNLNNELFEAKRKSIFLSGTMQPIMGFVGNLGYVVVCIVGGI